MEKQKELTDIPKSVSSFHMDRQPCYQNVAVLRLNSREFLLLSGFLCLSNHSHSTQGDFYRLEFGLVMGLIISILYHIPGMYEGV